MPNHIVNRITAPEEVLDLLKSREGEVMDFNALVPMPPSLSVSADVHTIEWAEIAVGKSNPVSQLAHSIPGPQMAARFREGDYDSVTESLKASNLIRALGDSKASGPLTWEDDRFEMFIQMQRNIRHHGYPTWYDWSVEHWGTKWNAYDCERVVGSGVVTFQTAWSIPKKIAATLFERFPAAKIKWEWADEDSGNNAGFIDNGSVVVFDNGSPEAWALYIDLHENGQCPEHLQRQPDGTYRYVEEDE